VGFAEEEAAAIFAEGIHFAERDEDLAARARLLDAYAPTRVFAGHALEGRGLVQEALGVAERLGDRAHQVALQQRMNWIEVVLGNYSAALPWAEKVIALTQGDVELGAHVFGYSPAMFSMLSRILLLAYFGQQQHWVTAYEQVERLALEHDEIEIVAFAAGYRCETRILYGDAAAAHRDGARAAEMAEQLGSPWWIASTATNLAWASAEAGAFEDALATAERGLAVLRGKYALFEIFLLALLAEARAGTGDSRAACDTAREALALCRRFPEMRDSGVHAAYKIAAVLLRAEALSAEAVEAVELAEGLTRDTGFRALEPEALRVRAELERVRGDEAARRRALQQAHRILVEIGATARAVRVAQEMSE
jgi:tetratricopeptide (TPR) repeat protein